MLLWGGLRETTACFDLVTSVGSVCLKNPSVPHANIYGPEGAGFLSIKISDAKLWASLEMPKALGWHGLDQRSRDALLRLILHSCADPKEVLDELVVLASPMPRHDRSPPPWLKGVRARLKHEPDSATILQLASDYGVHPVYLARRFFACFGESPSVYRHRRMTARGLRSALIDGAPAAIAASEAGFADQSHMARTVRRQTGHSLTELKRILGMVSSVQE
jgi:AraC family transcriptional regulator